MKNKKQTKNNSYYWQKVAVNNHWIYYVVVIFIVGVIFSWTTIATLVGHAFVSSFYLLAKEEAISTGGKAAMTEEQVEDNYYRKIDGVLTEEGLENKIPYAVMIENLSVVRPQSGLQSASVVYEALVEGGATRFMAVFDTATKVDTIMPVRSARPYYLEWSSEYGAPYAHAGGSPAALTIIRQHDDIKDLEALGRQAPYFWRDTSKYAPHNLVTSSEKMNFALRDYGLDETEAEFQSWPFKDDADMADRKDAKQLKFNFSYGLTYEVKYDYNKELNVYGRINGGQPHTDANTGEQIAVKNIVVQIVPEPILNGGKGRLEINVGGKGKAWIMRDGELIEGTWSKDSRTDRTWFYDAEGNKVEFNRGNTWIHILPETQEVFYE